MASAPRKPVDLGFAEFAAQLVAELHEAVLSAQADQDQRRTELAGLAAMQPGPFARRFVADAEIDAELARLFPGRGGKGHRIRAGLRYDAATPRRAEAPPIQTRLGIRLERADLQRRGKQRVELTAAGVKTVREAVRLRIAEERLKPLRQMASQGMPRVLVDSGHVNVKLSFRLVDLDRLGARGGREAEIPLKPLFVSAAGDSAAAGPRMRLVVRQVNGQTAPAPPPQTASGIGELQLTFKTV